MLAGTNDQVAFPIAKALTLIDECGTLVDGDLIWDRFELCRGL